MYHMRPDVICMYMIVARFCTGLSSSSRMVDCGIPQVWTCHLHQFCTGHVTKTVLMTTENDIDINETIFACVCNSSSDGQRRFLCPGLFVAESICSVLVAPTLNAQPPVLYKGLAAFCGVCDYLGSIDFSLRWMPSTRSGGRAQTFKIGRHSEYICGHPPFLDAPS
eukprot:jgi/Botrbrau1/6625/Bobra.104_2s0012.1